MLTSIMDFVSQNIRYLRKNKGLTQEDLAEKLGVNRAMIGSYEEGRAIPKLSVLQDFAYFFSISIDLLINSNLSELPQSDFLETDKKISGENLRIVSTVVDKENKELITSVPVKASAGYTNGYSDPEFIDELPRFSLPFQELSQERTYRVFQIKGDSMEPIPSGSYIICEYLINWQNIQDGKPHIIITKDEGVVYKRVYKKTDSPGDYILKSDNLNYEPYVIQSNDIIEMWKALGYISFNLPEPNDLDVNKLHQMILNLQNEVGKLKK